MKIEFDYKPVTRDEVWKAKEIELLEQIIILLKSNIAAPTVTITDLPGTSLVEKIVEKKPAPKRKSAAKKVI